MKHYYPAVPISWALEVTTLTSFEVKYGIAEGLLSSDEQVEFSRGTLDAIAGNEVANAKDILFRLLLINLHKRWFIIPYPLRALEYLVQDFEDCPTSRIGDGHLPSGIAGISETDNPAELDPDYFARKVKTFRYLTTYVVAIVQDGVRTSS